MSPNTSLCGVSKGPSLSDKWDVLRNEIATWDDLQPSNSLFQVRILKKWTKEKTKPDKTEHENGISAKL
ncbi:hypothetical protein Tco_0072323 [Tanacetum coccineum]